MKTYKVLVFPCGTEIANEIINSLAHHKYFKRLYASSDSESYCHFRGEEIHHLPYINDENFSKELKLLVDKYSIDFIIPAHDDVAYALSQPENATAAKIIGQSKHVNEIVRFKEKTYEHFKGTLPLAKIYRKEEELEFPIFVKPNRGQGSQHSFSIESQEEFETFKKKYNAGDFVWMELLTGKEYTIDCFSDKGTLLFAGPRTRDKTTRGISTISKQVTDKAMIEEFEKYARIISEDLQMHGIWFFQMKKDRRGDLKLLEIGPRVSGTMMLNRARGVNFVELALYQALGYRVEVMVNDYYVELARALVPIYRTNLKYENLYVDFDDTLLIEEKYINPDIMKLIFQAKNEGKKVILITKNKKNNLAETLHKFGIGHVFDEIIHLKEDERKVDFMRGKALLIDDSFAERKEAIANKFMALGCDNSHLIKE